MKSNAKSIQSPINNRTIQEICQSYGLGELINLRSADGYANKNYLLECESGKYFLKIYMDRPHSDIQSEQKITGFIGSNGILAPKEIATKNGDRIYKYRDLTLTICEYIDGACSKTLNTKQISEIGKTLASLHNLNINGIRPRNSWWRRNFLIESLSVAKKRFNYQYWKPLANKISKLDYEKISPLRKSTVHGDPWALNALYSDNQLSALVDWEECTVWHSIFDLMYAAIHNCFPDDCFEIESYQSLLTSYQSIRKLHDMEKQNFHNVIEWIVCTNSLWLLLKSKNSTHPENGEILDWYESLNLNQLVHKLHV